MKLYTEEQVDKMLSRARMHKQDDTEMFTNEYLLSKEIPIELPSDEDGSELNKELTLDERMHLWFESSKPNRDVCDYVDEMNDIDKAKYLDGCGISRTTKL